MHLPSRHIDTGAHAKSLPAGVGVGGIRNRHLAAPHQVRGQAGVRVRGVVRVRAVRPREDPREAPRPNRRLVLRGAGRDRVCASRAGRGCGVGHFVWSGRGCGCEETE